MAVTSDIVFSIGALGINKTKVQFAALAAAVFMVGKKMASAVAEGQKYQQMIDRLTVDMTEYNKATKGQIDTTAGLVGANKLAMAGLQTTAKEMRAIGVAAIEMAKATGTDATAAFNRLVKSVSKGESRALKEFGIEIENTEDLVLAQREALDLLTASYGEHSIEIETAAEQYQRFDNALGTFTDQVGAATGGLFGQIGALTGITENLERTTQRFDETGGRVNIFTEGITRLKFEVLSLTDALGITSGALDKFMRQYVTSVEKAKKITSLEREKRGLEQKQRAERLAEAKAPRRGRRGGGGAKSFVADMEFTLEDTASAIMSDEMRGDPLRRGLGPTAEDIDLMGGASERTYEDILAEERATEQAHVNARMAMLRDAADQEARIVAEAEAQKLAHRQAALQGAATMMGNLSSLMESGNKKAFAAGKAFAYAETLLSGLSSAQKSYEAMASIPIVGPVLGFAAAAASMVATGARLAAISRMKPGTSSGSFSGGGATGFGGGGVYTNAVGGTNNMPTSTLEGGAQRTINIVLDDEVLGTALVNINSARSQKGQTSFAEAS